MSKIIGEQIDFSKAIEYNQFFKAKLTELVGGVWIRSGAYPTIRDKKLIFRYICNKSINANHRKNICRSKCVVEMNMETKMAKIFKNDYAHNHGIKKVRDPNETSSDCLKVNIISLLNN